ncbi:MAG: helix-turn-helix domain-containing protein, partial [Ferruginibacter sp.]
MYYCCWLLLLLRLSADDIAAHLGVTKDTVYAWVSERA